MSSSAYITLIMFVCVILMSLSYFIDIDKRKRHDEIVEKINTLQTTVELFNNPKVVKTLRLQEYRAGTPPVVGAWDTVAYEYRRVGSALEIRSTDP
ncbi:MAG: hypothetical protein KAQ85_02265, partial [Thermodesulfovibrionia bacterium]|nr:hypothetical protein [Thermodesulfovibrionia bacterium]